MGLFNTIYEFIAGPVASTVGGFFGSDLGKNILGAGIGALSGSGDGSSSAINPSTVIKTPPMEATQRLSDAGVVPQVGMTTFQQQQRRWAEDVEQAFNTLRATTRDDT